MKWWWKYFSCPHDVYCAWSEYKSNFVSEPRCEFHETNSDVNWIRFLIWPHPTPGFRADTLDKQESDPGPGIIYLRSGLMMRHHQPIRGQPEESWANQRRALWLKILCHLSSRSHSKEGCCCWSVNILAPDHVSNQWIFDHFYPRRTRHTLSSLFSRFPLRVRLYVYVNSA